MHIARAFWIIKHTFKIKEKDDVNFYTTFHKSNIGALVPQLSKEAFIWRRARLASPPRGPALLRALIWKISSPPRRDSGSQ